MHREDDDRLVRLLREEYRPPPELPRDEVWQRIRDDLAEPEPEREPAGSGAAGVGGSGSRWRHGLRARLPAAAVLVLAGMGLGWFLAPGGESPAGEGEPDDAFAPPEAAGDLPEDEAHLAARRAAAHRHLAESEFLLALVRTEARRGEVGDEVPQWADVLLTETRDLLQDPTVRRDPRIRDLLVDLELVMAQVAQLDEGTEEWAGATELELELIAEGLEHRDVLSRIHATLPTDAEAGGH